MNPKSLPLPKVNTNSINNNGIENHDPSSLGNLDSDLQRWFLSLVCLDSPVHAFAPTRGRSAFSWYQLPTTTTMESKQPNASLVDTTLDENESENEYRDSDDNNHGDEGGERDDLESPIPNFSSIERTFSFDDWDDGDDYTTPVSPTPHVFRFDDWSSVSKDSDSTCVNANPPSASKAYHPKTKSSNETNHIKFDSDDNIIHKDSSSMMAMIPPTSSYLFQPIQEGSSSRLSGSITAPPSLSIRSIDLLSLNEDEGENNTVNNDHVTIPECPGIPRVGSHNDEEEDDLYHPVIFSITLDDMSPCISSPTNHDPDGYNAFSMPPIPQVIFLPREPPKGWRRTIQHSWNRMASIRRRNYFGRKRRMSSSGRRFLPRKGLRGEF